MHGLSHSALDRLVAEPKAKATLEDIEGLILVVVDMQRGAKTLKHLVLHDGHARSTFGLGKDDLEIGIHEPAMFIRHWKLHSFAVVARNARTVLLLVIRLIAAVWLPAFHRCSPADEMCSSTKRHQS